MAIVHQGGTGGSQGVSAAAIAALDPDKYLGTLGTTADAPKGATNPHYVAFPASNAGGWLRVVSDTKIGTVEIINKQEWICLQDNTPANTPANWELCQQGDLAYQEIAQANSFVPPCVLRREGTNYVLAIASSAATSDNWLCISATATSFRIANASQMYYFKDHGLGADGEVLRLSPTENGKMTTSAIPIGSYLVLIGRIFDKDNILWIPSLRIDEVLA